MQVEISNEEVIPIDQICPNCEMEIEGQNFSVNLIPIKLREFDVILGMDWLTKCEAHIDCKGKKITIKLPGEKIVTIRGLKWTRKILTLMQTKRLLRQGCEAYLAYVLYTEKKIPNIEEVEVVNEFKDVFPEDLPGLPPDREIEFVIDLVPGVAQVSKAPYQLASVELKELATQIQELLDKGMIRPSVSPWGCSNVVCKEERRKFKIVY